VMDEIAAEYDGAVKVARSTSTRVGARRPLGISSIPTIALFEPGASSPRPSSAPPEGEMVSLRARPLPKVTELRT